MPPLSRVCFRRCRGDDKWAKLLWEYGYGEVPHKLEGGDKPGWGASTYAGASGEDSPTRRASPFASPASGEAKGTHLRTLKNSFSSVADSVSPTAEYTSGT